MDTMAERCASSTRLRFHGEARSCRCCVMMSTYFGEGGGALGRAEVVSRVER